MSNMNKPIAGPAWSSKSAGWASPEGWEALEPCRRFGEDLKCATQEILKKSK